MLKGNKSKYKSPWGQQEKKSGRQSGDSEVTEKKKRENGDFQRGANCKGKGNLSTGSGRKKNAVCYWLKGEKKKGNGVEKTDSKLFRPQRSKGAREPLGGGGCLFEQQKIEQGGG